MIWNVGKILTKRAALSAAKTAIIFEDQPITYRELNHETNRIVRLFQDRGLEKGDRVAAVLLNCPEFIACYMAAAKMGLIFVPLNYRLVSKELEFQLNWCSCCFLFFHDLFTPQIDSIRHRICVGQDRFIVIPTPTSSILPDLPSWANDYHRAISAFDAHEPVMRDPIDLDDPLLIMYTSGVTGHPKGAVITHGQTYFKCFQIINYTDMRQDDIFHSQAPLCHSAGLCAVTTPALCRGATLLIRYHFDAETFATDIEKYRPTIVFGLTTMFRFILDKGLLDAIDTSSIRFCFGGGERTSTEMLDALAEKGICLLVGFGQTENSAMALMPEWASDKKRGSIGLPNFFTELWIVDKGGNQLPPGQIGEIVAIGPNIMKEYWNMPEQTSQTIVNNVLHTGDLGYMDEDGFFYVVDRVKDMYRTGAENVFPSEVETLLAAHPKIENVAIIGIPDEKWGETGKAYVQCKAGEQLTIADVHSFLDGKVAKFKFPAHIEHVDELPVTVWGKIKKSVLREWHMKSAAQERTSA